ncbi:23S rRNA pseudouridine synthase F [bacterium]|nr:23S rRNA pseudouridine synthase F [bacterium]|tara:strand:+ start:7231 stop:7983 length:753 start_codon:yes stop_codon:yes gene_type:complete
MATGEYPIRINRYLLLKNYCSRREADRLIEQKKVFINGVPAVLGQKVNEGDEVRVAEEVEDRVYKYYLYNKPRGIVSHLPRSRKHQADNPHRDEQAVEDVSGLGTSVSVVGRLDKDSHGLMLLTDDGRIVDAILNPKYEHEREYEVRVDKYLKESDLKKLSRGVSIEGYITKPAKATRLGDNSFALTLTEGKKHQIRRMCAALGYQVRDLKRIRMMHLVLNVESGKHRPLTDSEKRELLRKTGVTSRDSQ